MIELLIIFAATFASLYFAYVAGKARMKADIAEAVLIMLAIIRENPEYEEYNMGALWVMDCLQEVV